MKMIKCLTAMALVFMTTSLAMAAFGNLGLIRNPGFEAGIANWTVEKGTPLTGPGSWHWTGSFGCVLLPGDSYANRDTVYQNVGSLLANTDYELHVWKKQVYNSGGNDYTFQVLTADGLTELASLHAYTDSGEDGLWVEKIISFNTGSNTDVRLRFSGATNPGADKVAIDELSIYGEFNSTTDTLLWVDTRGVVNGNFNTRPVENGWTVAHDNYYWQSSGATNSAGNPYPGVRLSASSDNVSGSIVQDINGLDPNTRYTVTVDTDFYGTQNFETYNKVYLRIYGANDDLLGETSRSGGNGWETLCVPFTTSALTAIRIQMVGCNKSWEPESYWDNVRLFGDPATIYFADTGAVKNGDFANLGSNWTIEQWDPNLGSVAMGNGYLSLFGYQVDMGGWYEQRKSIVSQLVYSLVPNTDYVLRLRKRQKQPNNFCDYTAEVTDTAGIVLGGVTQNTPPPWDPCDPNTLWQDLDVVFNTGNNTTVRVRLESADRSWEPMVWFDDIQIWENGIRTPVPVKPLSALKGHFGEVVYEAHTDQEADGDGLAELGLQIGRMDVVWESVEDNQWPGQHIWWKQHDYAINTLLAGGTEPLVILAYNNDIYAQNWQSPIKTQTNRDAFAAYCAYVVSQTKGRVTYFEIWNEAPGPNGAWNYTGGAADFALLLANAYPAIKAANPQAVVMTPALPLTSASISWWQDVLAAGGGNYYDVVSYHPWVIQNGNSPEQNNVLGDYQTAAGIEPGRPIWITEFGYSYNNYGEHNQAKYLVRAALLAQSVPEIKRWIVYSYRNFSDDLGLTSSSGTVKRESYYAMQTLGKMLRNYDFDSSSHPVGGYDYKFIERDTGDWLHVLWRDGAGQSTTLTLNAAQVTKTTLLGTETVLTGTPNSPNWDYTVSIGQDVIYLKPVRKSLGYPLPNGTVAKERNNVLKIVFDSTVSLPGSNPVEIKMIGDANDIAGDFTYSLATTYQTDDTLVCSENGDVLSNDNWYRINRKAGVTTIPEFTRDFAVLYGDADGSGEVSKNDYEAVKAEMFSQTNTDVVDLNGDGIVLADDYMVVKDNWAKRVPAKP